VVRAAAPAAPSGARALPARSRADQGTCSRVALIANHRNLDRNTSRDQTKITRRHFQLRTGRRAGALAAGATISALQRSAAGDAGVSSRSWPKVGAL
jgi:hypothetical protein